MKNYEGFIFPGENVGDKKCIHFSLIKYAKPDEHKAMFKQILDYMKNNDVKAFLHDISETEDLVHC